MDPLQELKDRFDSVVRKLQEALEKAHGAREELEQGVRESVAEVTQRDAEDDDTLPIS